MKRAGSRTVVDRIKRQLVAVIKHKETAIEIRVYRAWVNDQRCDTPETGTGQPVIGGWEKRGDEAQIVTDNGPQSGWKVKCVFH